jgi:GR25 family glycosyltransferase involved in LPS biosynthesis
MNPISTISSLDNEYCPAYDRWTFKFYCVSLASSTERRERIRKRFAYHGLLPWLTFVDAIPMDSGLIKYYVQGIKPPTGGPAHQFLATASCFASHLKALRTYLEDNNACHSKGVVICEDDILLKNNWDEHYHSIMNNMPDDANLIQFSYMLDKWDNTCWSGKNRNVENVFKFRSTPKSQENINASTSAWGTQMYWISLPQAINSLNKFDKPFVNLKHHSLVTSELITILPMGYLVYPPLAIEDCQNSLIRDDEGIQYHLKIFSPWGYSHYSGGDDDGVNDPISPLFEAEKKLIGKRPPPPPPPTTPLI